MNSGHARGAWVDRLDKNQSSRAIFVGGKIYFGPRSRAQAVNPEIRHQNGDGLLGSGSEKTYFNDPSGRRGRTTTAVVQNSHNPHPPWCWVYFGYPAPPHPALGVILAKSDTKTF